MNLLLFGPPGAGKGTQSAFLIERLGLKHISTGDLFRFNIKNKTPLGLEAKTFIDAGNLVPDKLTIAMVEQEVEGLAGTGFILDGFPRTVAQAEALGQLLERHGLDIGKVIFLDVAEKLLLDRLTGRRVCKSCGAVFHIEHKPTLVSGVCDICQGEVVQRVDDQEEAIKNRLGVYASSTTPVKEYYGNLGKLINIDGTGKAEEVFKRLEGALEA